MKLRRANLRTKLRELRAKDRVQKKQFGGGQCRRVERVHTQKKKVRSRRVGIGINHSNGPVSIQANRRNQSICITQRKVVCCVVRQGQQLGKLGGYNSAQQQNGYRGNENSADACFPMRHPISAASSPTVLAQNRQSNSFQPRRPKALSLNCWSVYRFCFLKHC